MNKYVKLLKPGNVGVGSTPQASSLSESDVAFIMNAVKTRLDPKIFEALKKFTCSPRYGARFTDLQRETGLSDGALTRGLNSLRKRGEIVRIGSWYALPEYEEKLAQKVKGRRSRKASMCP